MRIMQGITERDLYRTRAWQLMNRGTYDLGEKVCGPRNIGHGPLAGARKWYLTQLYRDIYNAPYYIVITIRKALGTENPGLVDFNWGTMPIWGWREAAKSMTDAIKARVARRELAGGAGTIELDFTKFVDPLEYYTEMWSSSATPSRPLCLTKHEHEAGFVEDFVKMDE